MNTPTEPPTSAATVGLFEAISQVQRGRTVTIIVAPEPDPDIGSGPEGHIRVTVLPGEKSGGDAKSKTGKKKAGEAASQEEPPFTGFSFVGDPREIDDREGGLAGLFAEEHRSAQTLSALRQERLEANKQAEAAEKRLKELAEKRKLNATTDGPLFQKEGKDTKKKK